MAFIPGIIEAVTKESTKMRDRFISCLEQNGFVKTETNGQGYMVFKYKINNWLWVRAYRDHYEVRLTGDYDFHIVRSVKYDDDTHTQQLEGFMLNCIMKNQ